ncbi:MAG: hypothetical protein C5B52_18015 [Bacteroidetes bacterium]|nr:MAG: hypothetical protein C5B52_18015 [Bacteroidota bacterium]
MNLPLVPLEMTAKASRLLAGLASLTACANPCAEAIAKVQAIAVAQTSRKRAGRQRRKAPIFIGVAKTGYST